MIFGAFAVGLRAANLETNVEKLWVEGKMPIYCFLFDKLHHFCDQYVFWYNLLDIFFISVLLKPHGILLHALIDIGSVKQEEEMVGVRYWKVLFRSWK